MAKIVPDTPRETVKTVTTLVTGTGVAFLVREVLQNNTTIPETKWGKIKLFIGTIVVTSMVVKASDNYIEAKIDKGFDIVKKIREDMDGAKDGGSEATREQPEG